MYSRKEDFLSQLQYKIGDRWEDIDSEHTESAKSLINFLQSRHNQSKWPFLNFLPFYTNLKSSIEKEIGKNITSSFNLNDLKSEQRKNIISCIDTEEGINLEMKRPKMIHQFIFIFPLIGILGSMLMSTYLITSKDASGFWYLSGLLGLIISLLLFNMTKKLKSNFSPNLLLDYSKSYFVVNIQVLKINYSNKMLEKFILDELELHYNESFNLDSKIPD